ncbi:MAG: SPFH domain-containing protein, partial [bacterium]
PTKSIWGFVVFLVAVVMAAWGLWMWGFCRFYVPPGCMAVVTAKAGAALRPGQILAKNDQKGVREETLTEGRHFLNPIAYEWQIVPAQHIPAGKVGIVTSKVGEDLPPGEFLARDGQKGIWKNVLGPGVYRLNPLGYQVDIQDAISIPIGYVGVVTSLSGVQAPDGSFATAGQEGVLADVLQPVLYYLNPNAYKVDILEIGLNQVSLTGRDGGQVLTKGKVESQNAAMEQLQNNMLAKQMQQRMDYLNEQKDQAQAAAPAASLFSRGGVADKALRRKEAVNAAPQAAGKAQAFVRNDAIATFSLAQFVEFPSRDGFEVRLDMTVEFELEPDKVAMVYLLYGDLPAVVDKIIMPQVLSVSRLKGSSYGAQDFILGEGREKFQNDLQAALGKVLKEKHIRVHNSIIRHVEVPEQILAPIQAASLAVEQDLTNKAQQVTAQAKSELNTQEGMIEQKRQEVQQGTEKLVAEIAAETEKRVATINATAGQAAAETAQKTAGERAAITRTLGEAKSQAYARVEGERARGFQVKVKAFGDPAAYTALGFAEGLSSDLRVNILHAGPGTLWTDLKGANLGDLGGARLLAKPPLPP